MLNDEFLAFPTYIILFFDVIFIMDAKPAEIKHRSRFNLDQRCKDT